MPWYIANITSSWKFGVRLMLFPRVILRDWTAISILPALPSGDLQTFRKAENSHIQWISRVPFFQRVPCIVSRKHQERRSKHQAAKLCVAPFTCQIWSRFWRGAQVWFLNWMKFGMFATSKLYMSTCIGLLPIMGPDVHQDCIPWFVLATLSWVPGRRHKNSQ